jgi:rhodanese-related sulfurtransferase
MKSKLINVLCLILTFSFIAQNNIAQQQEGLPKEKQTTLGLYVTSKEAYEMWKSSPENIKILDVRTQEEYLFVGHADMAWNIPVFLQSYEWDSTKKNFPMKPNSDFINQVKELFQPDDIILVTCRSGGRSAMAVNYLADSGFKNIYNITDGFEGDLVKDPESVFLGQRKINGWKNSGLPWTYKIDPKLMLISDTK